MRSFALGTLFGATVALASVLVLNVFGPGRFQTVQHGRLYLVDSRSGEAWVMDDPHDRYRPRRPERALDGDPACPGTSPGDTDDQLRRSPTAEGARRVGPPSRDANVSLPGNGQGRMIHIATSETCGTSEVVELVPEVP